MSLYPVVGPPLFGHCRSRSNCLVCVLHAIAYKPISLCMHSVRNQLTLSLMTKRHLNAHFRRLYTMRRSVDVVAFDSRSQKVDQSNSTLLNDVFTRSDRQKRAVCGGSKCPCPWLLKYRLFKAFGNLLADLYREDATGFRIVCS